jgi:two-component system phosphate regulon sensor histidine kinase PhoR
MLQITIPNPCGRTIPELVRNRQLQEFITKSLESSDPIETRILLHEAGVEQHLQAHGTALLDGQAQRIGALIVLNDITELHKLQMVRTDFVANVSHELKTPVTSIKGFIETLLDGAKNRPEDLQRFLEIISRQTERLNSIIDDLLTLSRVEQQTEKAQISFEDVSLRGILLESVELCHHRAEQKQISLEVDCQEGLRAYINPSLLEQALVNLIDNAVKYSDPGNPVSVRAFGANREICIEIKDCGCGIAKEHQPRLFERFYRVDKARSRKLGGTGLGLAIVKHIVQAHKGQISIDSVLGTGSTFTLHLPVGED